MYYLCILGKERSCVFKTGMLYLEYARHAQPCHLSSASNAMLEAVLSSLFDLCCQASAIRAIA